MKIADFNPKIVGQMLEYLYSAELPNKLSGQNLFELLKIAEKYDLKMLKSISEEKMILRFYYKYKNDKIKNLIATKVNCEEILNKSKMFGNTYNIQKSKVFFLNLFWGKNIDG